MLAKHSPQPGAQADLHTEALTEGGALAERERLEHRQRRCAAAAGQDGRHRRAGEGADYNPIRPQLPDQPAQPPQTARPAPPQPTGGWGQFRAGGIDLAQGGRQQQYRILALQAQPLGQMACRRQLAAATHAKQRQSQAAIDGLGTGQGEGLPGAFVVTISNVEGSRKTTPIVADRGHALDQG